jgi:hypothetical protein
MTTKLFVTFLLAIQLFGTQSFAQNACVDLFNESSLRVVDKVVVKDQKYNSLLNNLRSTLTGKLATVWRSEWKTKLSIYRSNQYVFNLLNQNLSAQTLQAVLKDINPKSEGFVRQVHQRMYDLQKKGLTTPEDKLSVRDAPPPTGATDSTFTYYTKPIVDAKGKAKHQPRIRTYLREVEFQKMSIDEAVTGSMADSSIVIFTRRGEDRFELNVNGESQFFNQAQLSSRFGKSFKMFAPHGKSYKLEIKSALEDMIVSTQYQNLNGNHTVQKLDVTLTQAQVDFLFAPLNGKFRKAQIEESQNRIETIIQQLITKDSNNEPRIRAIFDVMLEGVSGNSKFLEIEGATAYHRSAFESTTGFQTTVDRNQGVYLGDMYSPTGLKNPVTVLKSNFRLATGEEDARHVELKMPINILVDALGVNFADPASRQLVQHSPFDFAVIDNVAKLYNRFVTDVNHPGKFNYLRVSAAELISTDGP